MHLNTVISLSLLSVAVSALPAVRSRDAAEGRVSFPVTKRYTKPPVGMSKRDITATLTQVGGVRYFIDVSFGTPPQDLSLVLDTGSSDIWAYAVEANATCPTCTTTFYDPSESSTETKLESLGKFQIRYGSPNSTVLGYYAEEIVTVNDISLKQTIGVAQSAGSGDPMGGIFGVGLPEGQSGARHGKQFPGYLDNLKAAGVIKNRAYSVFLDEASAADSNDGTIIFGAPDSSRYTGDLVAVPMKIPAPDGIYFLDVAEPAIAINAGANGTIAVPAVNSSYVVLIDSGTFLTRLPTKQFAPIANAVGAELSEDGKLYVVDCDLASAEGSLDFTFTGVTSNVTIAVPWAEVVIPQDGTCFFGLLPQADKVNPGTYILGDTFMRSAYVHFDFDAQTISFAQANYCDDSTEP